jgi:uncharacterized membrane-anchored protein YhcB (DUF1043 family)
VSPFNASEALCIGFFFGALIAYMVTNEIAQRRLERLLDTLTDAIEEVTP